MAANNARSRSAARRVTMAFRDDALQRKRLEAIQVARGHDDLSDTLREAVGAYIDDHWALIAGRNGREDPPQD